MIRLNLKGKAIALVIISGILSLVIIVFVIYPATESIKKIDNSITISEKEVEAGWQKTSMLKGSVKKLNEVVLEVDRLNEMTTDRNSELQLITMFEDLADKHQITQNLNMQFFPITKGGKKNIGLKDGGYYLFTLKNIGLFQNHLNYLRQLENNRLYMIVDNLSLKKMNQNNRISDQMELDITIKIYSKY